MTPYEWIALAGAFTFLISITVFYSENVQPLANRPWLSAK